VAVSRRTTDATRPGAGGQKAVDEMARTTKPGGHVIITVPNWWNPPYALGIWKMSREKTLHYGYAHLFSPIEIRKMAERNGLRPVSFASSIAPLDDVWL